MLEWAGGWGGGVGVGETAEMNILPLGVVHTVNKG